MNKNIIIFDLDGTLANTEECRHLLEGDTKRWDEFYLAATQVNSVAAVVKTAQAFRAMGYEIIIASGRSDAVRHETKLWLAKHDVPYDMLIMRRHKDHTPDDQLKKSWVDSGMIPKEQVLCVFEDRDRMVAMWRGIGLPCFQVATGDF